MTSCLKFLVNLIQQPHPQNIPAAFPHYWNTFWPTKLQLKLWSCNVFSVCGTVISMFNTKCEKWWKLEKREYKETYLSWDSSCTMVNRQIWTTKKKKCTKVSKKEKVLIKSVTECCEKECRLAKERSRANCENITLYYSLVHVRCRHSVDKAFLQEYPKSRRRLQTELEIGSQSSVGRKWEIHIKN